MTNFRKNEDAVSPVIGTILMVAVTVILAAIVAAFVFGMVSDVKSTKVVAVTASHQGSNLILTNMGGQDVAKVTQFNATYNGTEVTNVPGLGVGSTAKTNVGTGNAHLIVVAEFNDGSQQVVLDTYT
jgi:flagellin-like protein